MMLNNQCCLWKVYVMKCFINMKYVIRKAIKMQKTNKCMYQSEGLQGQNLQKHFNCNCWGCKAFYSKQKWTQN